MSRRRSRSKVESHPEIKAVVDGLLRDGRWTYQQIIDHLNGLAASGAVPAEAVPSHSGLGRYAAEFSKIADKMRMAQEMGNFWVQRLKADPDSDIGQTVQGLLKIVAFQATKELSESDTRAEANEIFFLAKAAEAMERAGSISADRINKIKKEIAAQHERELKEKAKAVDKLAKDSGLSEDRIAQMRALLIGARA